MNNPRYVFVVFKDTQNADSILYNNSRFINFKDNDNYIKSLQLVVDNVRYPIKPILIKIVQVRTFTLLLIDLKE